MTGTTSVGEAASPCTLLLNSPARGDDALLAVGAENETAPPPPLLPKKLSAKKRRKIRAKNAIKGTIAADHRIKITDRPQTGCVHVGAERSPRGKQMVDPHDAFSAEELAEMPIAYVASKISRLHIWRDQRGTWFRTAGYVRIQVKDGVRSIVVGLYDGADQYDLGFYESIVERLKAGRATNPAWIRITSDWADDKTFALVFAACKYVDPYVTKSEATKVFVCEEKLCREQVHGDDESHTLETLKRDLGRYFAYEIEINKYSGDPDARWYVNVDGGTELSEATPEMISTFANDLQWMGIECANANSKERAS